MNPKRTKAESLAAARTHFAAARASTAAVLAASGPLRVLRLATLQDCIDEYGSAIVDDAHMLDAIAGGHYVVISGGREARLRTISTTALQAQAGKPPAEPEPPPKVLREQIRALFDGLSVHDKKRGS